ncbi:DUF4199 domain-containing protein [Sediminitomix flava]|uniref:Uncharacterized protein DUF4199 n=1 Tax=Sediminitomix flava TaxID=379075 RepID=A0A315YX56_SEDFL|nr:DUF4199 domain-containing protein [Sediminitomix flava]PWJ34156.1 uncharacterized protein DUF4199 [Sediminitomix flava]
MNKKLFGAALTTGLAIGLSCFLYVIILHLFGKHAFGQLKYLYWGIYGGLLGGGMWYFKDKLNNYVLRAQHGLLFGFITASVSSTVFGLALFTLLSFSSLGEDMRQVHITKLEELMEGMKPNLMKNEENEDSNIIRWQNEEEYQAELAIVKDLSPKDLTIDQAGGMMMFGLFASFLFMLIFKTGSPKPTFNEKARN